MYFYNIKNDISETLEICIWNKTKANCVLFVFRSGGNVNQYGLIAGESGRFVTIPDAVIGHPMTEEEQICAVVQVIIPRVSDPHHFSQAVRIGNSSLTKMIILCLSYVCVWGNYLDYWSSYYHTWWCIKCAFAEI